MRFDIDEPVVAPEGMAPETCDKGIDKGVALFRGHVGLHGDQTPLAVDDRLADKAIEIGREEQPVINVEDHVAIWIDVRPDMGRRRKTADSIPKLGRTGTRLIKMIDQEVRHLLRCNEP